MRTDYYTYIHKRSNGDVVYVGKGNGVRAWVDKRSDPLHSRWCRWHLSQGSTTFCEVTDWYLTEEEALKKEKELVSHYERQGMTLFNKHFSKYKRGKQ